MDAGLAPPDLGAVHEIVVEEGEVVVRLESDGWWEAGGDVFVVEVIGHEHEHGPYAFASEGEDVAYGFVESFGLTLEGHVGDGCFHHLQELLAAIHYYI